MEISNHSRPSSSSTSSLANHYNVFLSFRGTDARYGFADVLYHQLTTDARLNVFRDREGILGGEYIHPNLVDAIDRSDLSIAIISPHYGESSSCLMELAHMSFREKTAKHKIIPIFFHADQETVKDYPNELVKKIDSSKTKLLDKVPLATVLEWKSALEALVKNLPKYYLLASDDESYWTEFVFRVVSDVQQILGKQELKVPDNLVPMDDSVDEIMRELGVGFCDGQDGLEAKLHDKDVRVLGITGVPGVGKSTLAYVVCNRIHHLFEACSCLLDIGETHDSLKSLQQQLYEDLNKQRHPKFRSSTEGAVGLSNSFQETRVLILLDDLHDDLKVEDLAQASWFGPGSRIIATVRDTNVLSKIKGTKKNVHTDVVIREARIYEVKPMEPGRALQLFQQHAFQGNPLQENGKFETLSKKIVKALGRLPLALETLGRNLFSHLSDINCWTEALEKVTYKPADKKVATAVEMSYNLLDVETKQIFLDIACFFNGRDRRIPTHMWQLLKYWPHSGLKKLCGMCLVKIKENNELWMHEEVRKFGWEKAEDKDPSCHWMYRRVWKHDEALRMLQQKKGNENVKALGLQFNGAAEAFTGENFKGLSELGFLNLDHAKISGNFTEHLPNLMWLDWRGCPAEIEIGELKLDLLRLVILDLSGSLVNEDWEGWNLIMEKAKGLKVLKLTDCAELFQSPDCSTSTNAKLPASPDCPTSMLERLIMEKCPKLLQVHPSIGNQKNLVFLSVKGCKKCKNLPELSSMEALEELLIDETSIEEVCLLEGSLQKLEILSARGCTKLTQIQHIGQLTSLTHLALDGSEEIELNTESIASLKNLQTLSLRKCKNVSKLPSNIGNLTSLEAMDLSYTLIKSLPQTVRDLHNLKVLKMEGTYLEAFPTDVTNLEKLEEVDFSRCRSMEGDVTSVIAGLISLRILKLSETDISSFPTADSISGLRNLQLVDLTGCSKLMSRPEFPPSARVELRIS